MCGIVGIVAKSPVNQRIYDALTLLQHRGQDAAGIVTYDHGQLYMRKANGLVRDVFSARHMHRLKGDMGIGHVRYPTAGCASSAEAQPFYVNSPYGIALAHNGNLTNTETLKRELFVEDRRHINTSSDSEVLLNVFAHELQETSKLTLTEKEVFAAVCGVHRRCRGAYAVIAMINGHGVLGFRDPYGIRPMIYGKKETFAGVEYMIASESVALKQLGFTPVRDIAPGEAVYIDRHGILHTHQCVPARAYAPCLFEFVYLARPDSMIDQISVYKARLRMGEKLAEKITREWPKHNIDVVIPIPDTSVTSSMPLAHALGLKMRLGFVKNRYIGRTFIMPGQAIRMESVRRKLSTIDLEFKDKNVLLVDDSIVRGTTSQQIVQMAREAGAKRVYFASMAPPVAYANVYGIDMPSTAELIGHGRSVERIREAMGADALIYQNLEDLISAVQEGNPKLTQFETSVFDGKYITGDISKAYLDSLAKQRNDSSKQQKGRAWTENALE